MKIFRSMLFSPAVRPDRVRRVAEFGADAVIIDLEDSVAADRRGAVRRNMPALLEEMQQQDIGVFVRINGWGTGELLEDLASVVHPGLEGIALSKVDGPEQVTALDLALSELEMSRGLTPGGIVVLPLAETARGMLSTYRLCTASSRVKLAIASSSPRGDIARAIGWRWTREGDESLYIRSKAVAEARAAGIDQILGGIVVTLDDPEFLSSWAQHCRQIGCTGMVAIHPSHITEINKIFTPSTEDVETALAIMHTMAAALVEGASVARCNGQMVDYAHVKTATALLERAAHFGVEVADYPHLIDARIPL